MTPWAMGDTFDDENDRWTVDGLAKELASLG